MKIQSVYEELKGANLCKSAYDFSVVYLGKNRSYYSVLKATRSEPSIEALVMLDYVLALKAGELSHSDHHVIKQAHATVTGLSSGIKLVIDEKCHKMLKNR